MDKIRDLCQYPRCSNKSDLVYISVGICDLHWIKLCDLDIKTMHKKLGIEYEEKLYRLKDEDQVKID